MTSPARIFLMEQMAKEKGDWTCVQNDEIFVILFQSVPTRMPGPAKSHAPWGQPVPTARAMAWNVCGAAAPNDAWTPMPTSSPSHMDSVWSGKLPPAPVSVLLNVHVTKC